MVEPEIPDAFIMESPLQVGWMELPSLSPRVAGDTVRGSDSLSD